MEYVTSAEDVMWRTDLLLSTRHWSFNVSSIDDMHFYWVPCSILFDGVALFFGYYRFGDAWFINW